MECGRAREASGESGEGNGLVGQAKGLRADVLSGKMLRSVAKSLDRGSVHGLRTGEGIRSERKFRAEVKDER